MLEEKKAINWGIILVYFMYNIRNGSEYSCEYWDIDGLTVKEDN